MSKDYFQLNDAKGYKHELEDILQECPSLKWVLCYAKIDLTKWSISDWLIHARVKLDVDLARGHFPIQHSLTDMDCMGAIEFLAILAYPLPDEGNKRLKFILANASGVLKSLKADANSKVRLSLNRNGWKLTSINKIERATNDGAERITKRLMHAQVVEQYLKEQTLFAEDNPRTFAKALYAVMDLYSTDYVSNYSDPAETKANQRKAYIQSSPVIHYAMAYWQVLASENKDPQEYVQAMVNPEWLPKVIAYGNHYLAVQSESSRSITLVRGDGLYKFEKSKKVYINQ